MKYNRDIFYKLLVIFAFIAVWEIASRLEIVNPLFIPPFSSVILTLRNMFISGNLAANIGISVERALVGFIISIIIGIPLGCLLGGWFSKVDLMAEPVIEIFSQVNPFILFHVLILFSGIGEIPKIVIIAWTCTWPIMFNTIYGIRHMDFSIIKTGRGFGLERWKLFWKVGMPSILPSVFVGIRISGGYSFFMLIAAEMMGASSGLGWLILNNQENYAIKNIFAIAIIIAFLGLLMDTVIKFVENKLLGYKSEKMSNGINLNGGYNL
ncbi:ABC transporter permease [Clostridium sp. MT-14]|uniref:ABC transporter permease n=1 Tax=Clostridium aromativorans TaxID=2836848 RepID=A0ABS8N5Z1_9CLOT|nr:MULTISPECIES: ABC transporter permease [Clostridium]KAA8679064.1 ABC transporter permease [Clostridium sp. HV4-5-A1G]MCC9295217.1 ABC transporter permease [Clostridium aromativorans]CAB1247678.1 Putative aliphatic sulfonates transport permease protein SsuC [Clostridiaceae bacterium BL-3]